MDFFETIKSRRSVRQFTDEEVDESAVFKLLAAGRWAPSGLNNQPWKFKVVRDSALRGEIAGCTKYSTIIKGAPVCIIVFFDSASGYDRTKDMQAIGACIQNILLQAHSVGLGAVWLGEILNQKDRVNEILDVEPDLELMAVLAIGHPKGEQSSSRKDLDDLLI